METEEDLAHVDLYLDAGGDVNATDFEGNTCLHIMTTSDRFVKHVLQRKANVDIKNKAGKSPVEVFSLSFIPESRVYWCLTPALCLPEMFACHSSM